MRAKRNPQYDEMFLGGLVGKLGKPGGLGGRVRNFAEKRPGLSKAIGLGGGLLANKAMGNKGAGLFPKMSGIGMLGMLGERLRQRRNPGAAADTRIAGAAGTQPGGDATMMDISQTPGVPQAENGTMIKKYRAGGMIYAQDSDQVTEKEKRFVQSAYGSGEDRITATDIKANPGLDPFREYIPGQGGMRAKKMGTPGYFLIPGYTDEQRQKDIEGGRELRDDQTFVLEVMPDGSKRAVSISDVMDEFTSGAEDEGLADVLEAMDIGITRTDSGFSLPSREEQIKALMSRRANYGLGDVDLEGLQKQLGLNVPEMQKGEYRDALERAMSRRASGQVTQARGSR